MKFYKVRDKYFAEQNEAGKYADEVGAMLVEVVNEYHEDYEKANHEWMEANIPY